VSAPTMATAHTQHRSERADDARLVHAKANGKGVGAIP